MTHTHSCDCTQLKSAVVQRGAQTSHTEATCSPTSSADAWNAQQTKAKSASASSVRRTATTYPSRGRSASL